MAKQATGKRRPGTAVWISEGDSALLKILSRAEDRTMNAIVRRSLKLYSLKGKEFEALLENADEVRSPTA